jgi:serine protease AprX
MTDKKHVARLTLVALALAISVLGLRGSTGEHRAHLSIDLAAHEQRHSGVRVRVIVHGTDADLDALARRHGLPVLRRLADGGVIAANSDELTRLAADALVDHLSGDVPVRNSMSISNLATAANQVRAGVPGGLLGLGGVPGVNGQGVTVAVVDSGIASHAALSKKVIASVSTIAGNTSTNDVFGHGTHVAGIIAGTAGPATTVTNLYTGGIAPGASLVNVRVLGDNGVGLTSDVIAGIDWVIANKAKYNIRVLNLSLGHPVTEPCATDPLCQAVARASAANIVVVAAAGNAGAAADGTPILGGIMVPGNSPFAITVGALNTWGTVNRSDDTVATYSSRGPTRYDFAAKPDVAAPGNKIVSLQAANAYLPTAYPYLHVAGSSTNAYMLLSGTSMATPMVSGAIAALLQGTPGLSPAQVKLALQTGATFMPDGGIVGAGAGSVNFWASRQVAQNGLSLVTNTLIGGLVTPASGMAYWDAGTMITRLYNGLGLRLLSLLDLPLVWANPSLLNFGDLNLIGLLNPLGAVPARNLIWGQVATWTSEQQILWGTTIYNPQGQQILWGTDNTTDDDQILWGTAMTSPDAR